MANLFTQIAQAANGFNHASTPAQENKGAEQQRQSNPPGQDDVDRQLGRRLHKCQKLVTELQSVECCLLWFRDELPPALLLKNASELLGWPREPAFTSGFIFPPQVGDPSPPSAADLHAAKEFLQAAHTREQFMRLWHEQAYPAHDIHIPRKVASAKASLSIPWDSWQSFPDGEDTMITPYGLQGVAVNSGYEPCWTGDYFMDDWEHIVAYLEEETVNLEQAIGACFR